MRTFLVNGLNTSPQGKAFDGFLPNGARAGYLDHEYLPAIELWGSAYEAYRREADGVGAIRIARTLAYMYLSIIGDRAVMQGWFARAVSLLADEGPCPETGWVSLNRGMFESDRQTKDRCFHDALAYARESGDSSLEFATLAYLGASLVHNDRVEEGMLLVTPDGVAPYSG